MINFSKLRQNMIDGQIRPSGVSDLSILSAYQEIPREIFVNEPDRTRSYADEDLALGEERFLMEPSVHARLLKALAPQKHQSALCVFSGTGYSAAILSKLVSTVVFADEKYWAQKALQNFETLNLSNIATFRSDPLQGHASDAPYSLIFLDGAFEDVPEAICAQLAVEGRLVCVLRKRNALVGKAMLFERTSAQDISAYTLFDAQTPLISVSKEKEAFVF